MSTSPTAVRRYHLNWPGRSYKVERESVAPVQTLTTAELLGSASCRGTSDDSRAPFDDARYRFVKFGLVA